MVAAVVAGFGGFLARGGGVLDQYALEAAGADENEAKVRVSSLAGLEHGVLAIGGCGCAIAVLAAGLSQPPLDFTIPWAVIPVPGFLIAFRAAERYRDRFHDQTGWRRRLGRFLDSIHVIRELFIRPRRWGSAVLGMALFWAADAFALWAGLAMFGFGMNPAALFVGFAVGMVFTRRTGPLAGAGVLALAEPPVCPGLPACMPGEQLAWAGWLIRSQLMAITHTAGKTSASAMRLAARCRKARARHAARRTVTGRLKVASMAASRGSE